jgi:hypothetical protein
MMTAAELTAHNKERAEKSKPLPVVTEAVRVRGYSGKSKGIKQVLWERGLWVDGMTLKRSDKKPTAMCASEVLSQCADFLAETGEIRKLIEGRGHIMLESPVGHPEIAGEACASSHDLRDSPLVSVVAHRRAHTSTLPAIPCTLIAGNGIEYGWGFSKKVYRKTRLTHQNHKTHDHIITHITLSFRAQPPLTTLKWMRKTRRYLWAYQQKEALTFSIIEKFVKLHKTHRNILDQESGMLDREIRLAKNEACAKQASAERATIDVEYQTHLKFKADFPNA